MVVIEADVVLISNFIYSLFCAGSRLAQFIVRIICICMYGDIATGTLHARTTRFLNWFNGLSDKTATRKNTVDEMEFDEPRLIDARMD